MKESPFFRVLVERGRGDFTEERTPELSRHSIGEGMTVVVCVHNRHTTENAQIPGYGRGIDTGG